MSAVAELVDVQALLRTPEQLSAFFHMVSRLLPDGQVVLAVEPDTPARDALLLMKEHGFSQLPVREGEAVLGLFTYRAFALEVAQSGADKGDPTLLPVEEFLEHEPVVYARLQDEFRGLIDSLDRNDAVVVSGPDKLVAILTPMDVLRYLHGIANAFVLIEEIELSLRTLLRAAVPDEDVLDGCVANALSGKYKDGRLPGNLEEMTFDDYVALLRDGRNWEHFAGTFGGTLRNDVFHFKRELTVEDHQALSTSRDRLLRCFRKVQAQRRRR